MLEALYMPDHGTALRLTARRPETGGAQPQLLFLLFRGGNGSGSPRVGSWRECLTSGFADARYPSYLLTRMVTLRHKMLAADPRERRALNSTITGLIVVSKQATLLRRGVPASTTELPA